MEDAESLPQKEKPVSVMFIKRDGRDIKIGLYSPHNVDPNVDYPRPFIAKDSKGREVKVRS